jgi:hypothetical protein
MRKAIEKFEEFHQFEPRDIGTFCRGFRIPRRAIFAGDARFVLYRSDKLNPGSGEDEGEIDYIHEHDADVGLYRTDDTDGPEHAVPGWLCGCQQLVLLGECLGYGYYSDAFGEAVEAKSSAPFPELYTTPDGRALIVVQDKREVLALVWGGQLGVEWRGIVG